MQTLLMVFRAEQTLSCSRSSNNTCKTLPNYSQIFTNTVLDFFWMMLMSRCVICHPDDTYEPLNLLNPRWHWVKVIHACSIEMPNSQWCSSLWNYIPLFRKGSKFIHWLFFDVLHLHGRHFSCDELIPEISCADLKDHLLKIV